MRSMKELAAAGNEKITPRMDLKASDFVEIFEMADIQHPTDEMIHMVGAVYAIGFERGYRAGKK